MPAHSRELPQWPHITFGLLSVGYELRNRLVDHARRIFKGAEVSSLLENYIGIAVLLLWISKVLPRLESGGVDCRANLDEDVFSLE